MNYVPYEQNDLFFNYYTGEEYNTHNSLPEVDEHQIYKKCKKCENSLSLMSSSPKEWVCDGWDPPNTHCKGVANGKQLTENDKAFACPNVKHCNWIICEACYKFVEAKKEKEKKVVEDDGYEPFGAEPFEFRHDWEQEIEDERLEIIKETTIEDRKTAPSIKCIRSYQEYLDLAKGFHLTEPFCEKSYQDDTCEPCSAGRPGSKKVRNIHEAPYSILDMSNRCLYEKVHHDNTDEGCVFEIKRNKCRLEKGLVNNRGIIMPKLETENIFKFPITIKKTFHCNKPIKNCAEPKIHCIADGRPHTHWFPTNKGFIKYAHRHKGRFSQKKRGYQVPIGEHKQENCEDNGIFPKHPKCPPNFNITEQGKKKITTIPAEDNFLKKNFKPPTFKKSFMNIQRYDRFYKKAKKKQYKKRIQERFNLWH